MADVRLRHRLPALVLLLVTACTSSGHPAAGGSPSASTSTMPARQSVGLEGLVGRWQVQTPRSAAGTVVDVGPQVLVYLACGEVDEAWATSPSGLFVALQFGFSQPCLGSGRGPSLPWVEDARGIGLSDGALVLTDSRGEVLARLRRAATATPSAASGPAPTYAPGMDALHHAAPSLPAGVVPVTEAGLLGRWLPLPADAGTGRAWVSFAPDGTWRGSDGCNGDGGRYALGPDGEFLVALGASAGVGCLGRQSPAPGWVENARRLGLQSGRLVLVAGDGRVLGRLRRP